MKRLYLLSLLLIVACLNVRAQVTVTDKESGIPVTLATVYDTNGHVVGNTDGNGTLPDDALKLGKISISHVSYKTQTVDVDEAKITGSIALDRASYSINDVTVAQKKPEVIKLTAYFRNYVIYEGRMMFYFDGVAEYFIPLKKGKVKRRLRCVRRMASEEALRRDTTEENFSFQCSENLSINFFGKGSMMNAIKNKCTLKEAVNRTEIYYKNRLIGDIVTDTTENTCRLSYDKMFSDTTFTFKLFGFRFDWEKKLRVETYRMNENDYYSPSNIVSYHCYDRDRFTRKKWANQTYRDNFSDAFVLKHEYLTMDEMKSEGKKPNVAEGFTMPDEIPVLDTGLEEQVKKMKRLAVSESLMKHIASGVVY